MIHMQDGSINVPNPNHPLRMKILKYHEQALCGRDGAQGLYSKMSIFLPSYDGGEGERELKGHCDLN